MKKAEVKISLIKIFSDFSKNAKKQKLYKDLKDKKYSVHMVPEHLLEITSKKVNAEQMAEQFKLYLNTFINELENSLPTVNLSAFYGNVQNIEFKICKNTFNNENDAAFKIVFTKNGQKSVITFYSNNVSRDIWHEFLHLSTSRLVIDYEFIGFEQLCFGEKEYYIGRGLNEGYTEVLCGKYFKKHGAQATSYLLLQTIAQIIEIIVGHENMEKWYFESNFLALVNELKNYADKEEILLTIKKIDILNAFYRKKSYLPLISELYHEILYTIYNWYLTKTILTNTVDQGIMNHLTTNIKIHKVVINGLSLDEVINYANEFKTKFALKKDKYTN